MNRFDEMIQKGEDLIARTNALLEQDIDLENAGSVDIATYLTDLKAIHTESLQFTNPDVADSLEQYREGLENDEYMELLTRYLTVRNTIMGELRDRIYERTGRVDIAFKAKIEANNALHREMKALEAEIAEIEKDIAQLDKTIEILKNTNNEAAIQPLEDAKKNMLARIAEKRERIAAIPREQEALLHGKPAAAAQPAVTPEEDTPEVENPPLPEEDDADDVEDEEEEDLEEGHDDDSDLIPAFPELDDEDEEELGDGEDLEDLPVEDGDDSDSDADGDDADEEEEEEEDEHDLDPIPEDEEEIEVIHHTDAKPTLLRRIGNIVYAVVAFLSMAHLGVHIAEHGVSLDHEPALEEEIQQDEDDLEDQPAPDEDDQEDELDDTPTPDNQEDDPVVDTPDDQTPDEDDKTDDQTPGEDDNTDDQEQDDDKEDDKDQGTELGELPAELAPGDFIYDRESGLEVGATGDAYVHVGGETGGVTLNDGDRDLTSTDHGTVIVGAEDMTTGQKLPELTGEELTYEEVTQDMTAQEISDLDAALAEWAAQFDTGLTLKP